MIEITILDTTYPIRTSWNEVTFNQYCEIVKSKGIYWVERLSVYTGIPTDILHKVNLKQLQTILDLIEFMDEPDVIQAFAVGYESKVNVAEQPYWKVEKCKQLLKDNKHPVTVGAEIVELYTGDDDGNGGEKIGDRPVTKVIGIVSFFLQTCQRSSIGSNA